jgi:hypothetical protein
MCYKIWPWVLSACTIRKMDIERVNPLKHEVRLNNGLYLKIISCLKEYTQRRHFEDNSVNVA